MKSWIFTLCLLCSIPEGILNIAKSYLGVPYAANTLENTDEEKLVINEKGLDCTTFVELSVARWLSTRSDDSTFDQQVQSLRYRNGTIDGYLSRLHYFTDWVNENTRRGIWYELPSKAESASYIWHTDTLTLSFMSEHPQSYPYLKANPWAVDSMRTIEQKYTGQIINYIGKEYLNLTPKELPIKDGDIIALVTTIAGLDVTHLGFAIWQEDTLHLMHASTKQGKVIIDNVSLYEYLKNRNTCPGIRVVRLKKNDFSL